MSTKKSQKNTLNLHKILKKHNPSAPTPEQTTKYFEKRDKYMELLNTDLGYFAKYIAKNQKNTPETPGMQLDNTCLSIPSNLRDHFWENLNVVDDPPSIDAEALLKQITIFENEITRIEPLVEQWKKMDELLQVIVTGHKDYITNDDK